MAMREERSRLRTQVYILEKERATHEAQQQATAAQLRSLNTGVGFLDIEIENDLGYLNTLFTDRDPTQMHQAKSLCPQLKELMETN
jgi:hypothetical protein